MAVPGDSAEVLNALRFGWYVAEVRGRNRPGSPRPATNALPNRLGHVLPLRIERTESELRIEAQGVLTKLAGELGLDGVTDHGRAQSLPAIIDQDAKALAKASDDKKGAAWEHLASTIYDLDKHAQDTLIAQSETQACAYQLGRGLAETYWALNPATPCEPKTPDCWTFLIGEQRCGELTRLAGRLSAYFNAYSAPAIAGTLQLWKSVAADPQWRSDPAAHNDLYQQMRHWYELTVLGQDPSTLIRPYTLFRNWKVSLRAAQALWIQLATFAVSLGFVVALITLISEGSGNALVKAILGVLSAAGLSTATAQTRLKSTAQNLLTRIRQDAYTDLVAGEIAVAPRKPGVPLLTRGVTAELRNRTLTAAGDAAVP